MIERLFADPRRFDFFQAVRVLERRAARDNRDPRNDKRHAVGGAHSPSREVARFHVDPHLIFPGNPLIAAKDGENGGPAVLTATFMGLVGPLGVLPQHYSELAVAQARRRSHSLGRFLDIIHHRAISLFHRAWVKYRLAIAHERAELTRDVEEGATAEGALAALTGFGTGSMKDRLPFSDHLTLHFAGLLSATQRSKVGLETLLSALIGMPVRVESFVGSWLTMAPDQQTRLPSPRNPEGAFCRLGLDTVIGARAWDAQGHFSLVIGPVDHDQFLDFMPDGPILPRLAAMARLYVGVEHDIDARVRLSAGAVPEIRLPDGAPESGAPESDAPKRGAPRLGWNTWLVTGKSPINRDAAVFRLGGLDDDKQDIGLGRLG